MSRTLISHHPELSPLLTGRAQRARLLDAVIQVVGADGYARATVADVVRRARVSRGTFYDEFESKENCFAEALRAGADVLEERVRRAVQPAAEWREELRFGTRAWLRSLHEDPAFARAYLIEAHHLPVERDASAARLASLVGRSLSSSGQPVPPDEVVMLLCHGARELAGTALRDGRDVRQLEAAIVDSAEKLVPWR